jgi:hypothetical protein
VNELAVEMLHGIVPQESAANIVKGSHAPDDFLYADLLKTQAPDNQSAIGVLVEPSVTMNAAHFSFGAKLITASAARSMHIAGVPYRLAKAIFIPEYLIAPYVLSDEDTIPDLSRPPLDEVGTRILSASLAMLRR